MRRKAPIDGRQRLKHPDSCVSPGGRRHGGAAGASIPSPLTLGLFDVVSVRCPVGRRKDTTTPWASLDAGECYLALLTCRY